MTDYQESRKINYSDLHNLCSKECWCNLMTNDQYSEMLEEFSHISNITTEDIQRLAERIAMFTEFEDTGSSCLTLIMFKICRSTYTLFTKKEVR